MHPASNGIRTMVLFPQRPKRIDVILALGAALIGMMAAYSYNCWMDGFDRAPEEARKAKETLLGSGDLFKLHNSIYSKVGEYAWETHVKPKFMSEITYATILYTGNILPETEDVIGWVRSHPVEAHRMLVAASDIQEGFLQ